MTNEEKFIKELYKKAEKFDPVGFFKEASFVKEFDFSTEKLSNFNPAKAPIAATGTRFVAPEFNPSIAPTNFKMPSLALQTSSFDIKPGGTKGISDLSFKAPS